MVMAQSGMSLLGLEKGKGRPSVLDVTVELVCGQHPTQLASA